MEKKQSAWEKLAGYWAISCIENIIKEISLDKIKEAYTELLEGKASGRYVVKIA